MVATRHLRTILTPILVTEVELEDKDTHDAVHRVIRQALGELSANVDADFRLPSSWSTVRTHPPFYFEAVAPR